MRIGLFGGTFDPIHLGHLRVAEEVLEKKHLDQIVFVPAGCPPHRSKPNVSPEHRLAMVRQAIKKNNHFSVSDYEIKKSGKAYTFETLQYFTKKNPHDQLYLILGADQWLSFSTWHQGSRILDLCRIIVMSRPKIEINQSKPIINRSDKRVNIIKVSKLDISSTDIRRRLHYGHSIRYLVHDHVAKYITDHQLYR